MKYFLTTQGGIKIPVKKEVIELIQRTSTPCEPNNLPNPCIKDGREYYTYQREDGKWCTRITTIAEN